MFRKDKTMIYTSNNQVWRGKRLDNGKWIYHTQLEKYFGNCTAKIKGILVDARTLCEYMGCKDSRGRRIFEGDYIKIKGSKFIYIVPYNKDLLLKIMSMHEVTVVGNRLDNPKLFDSGKAKGLSYYTYGE